MTKIPIARKMWKETFYTQSSYVKGAIHLKKKKKTVSGAQNTEKVIKRYITFDTSIFF